MTFTDAKSRSISPNIYRPELGDLTARYTYNEGNQLLSADIGNLPQRTYSYDAVGNRTGVSAGGQSLVSYAYDAANRLSGVTQFMGGVPSGMTQYSYNPRGDRLSSTFTDLANPANNSSTQYLLDLNSSMTMVLGEFGNDGDTYYLLGLDVIGQQMDMNWSYMGYDGLGSVRQVRVDTALHDRLGGVTDVQRQL